MGYKCILIHLSCLIQILNLIKTQNLNIKKIGGANFANLNMFEGSGFALMGISKFPYSDEKIIYDIGGNLLDRYSIEGNSLTINKNASFSSNFTYRNFSGLSFFFDSCWISITGNKTYETYNLTTRDYYNFDLEDLFGFPNISEFGNVVDFLDEDLYNGEICYVFPFIIANKTKSEFVLFMINSNKLPIFSTPDYLYRKECKNTKVISCTSTNDPPKIICLFINTQNMLTLEIYSNTLEVESQSFLDKTSGDVENMFFKVISFDKNACIVAYYTNINDENLKIEAKQIDYLNDTTEIHFKKYPNIGKLSIDAKDFNKNYMLNDIIKTYNDDIYFATTSLDREILYIIKLKVNSTKITKQAINMFQENNMKFYKDLKLVNNDKSFALGFSHCNQKKCEEKSYHSSSLMIFSDQIPDYNFDLLKNIYNSNYKSNDSLLIDLNIYQNNLIGYKFKSIKFNVIPEGISLHIPKNNSKVLESQEFDFSTFKIKYSLNTTGNFILEYTLYFDDSSSTTRRLRRLSIDSRDVSFTIQISQELSSECEDELCSLCSKNSPSECLSCKYDYSIVGDKKFCFDEDGEMDDTQINDIYNNFIGNMEDQNFMTIKQGNAVLQFLPVAEQKTNDLEYVSAIDLGDCESKLKKQEGLDDDEEFLMVKLDIKKMDISATYVQYEIYNPHTLQIVNTNVCRGETIKIHTPVSMSESKRSVFSSIEDAGYNALDIHDDFYNDVCTPYTAKNGADLVLSSRKRVIYDSSKNIYFCQTGCELSKFNSKNNKAECNCDIQLTKSEPDITKLHFEKTKFVDSFYKTLYNSNFRVLKCMNLVFSLKGLKANYGSYLMIVLIGICIAFIVLFLITGQQNIMNILNIALKSKGIEIGNENFNEKITEKGNEQLKEEDTQKEHKKDEAKKDEAKKDKAKKEKAKKDKAKKDEPKQNEQKNDEKAKKRKSKLIKKHKRKSKNLKTEDLQAAPKKRHSKSHHKKKSIAKEVLDKNPNSIVINTNMDLIENPEEIKEKDRKEKKKHHSHRRKSKGIKEQNIQPNFSPIDEIQIIQQAKILNDEEINTLEYEFALIIDKRTYCQYYISLIKKKQLILFTFLPSNDYNLMPIKIILFIISFSLYFTINGFFFSDDTMDKIYEDNGAFNIIYQLPQIFYSSLISTVINMILKLLSLSEKQIIEIKRERDPEKSKEMALKSKKMLNIKLLIFIILSIIFMLFFWYFISCFCSVYQNTQLALIEDTLLSFFLSMLYPFVIYLFPGFFRIPALRAPNKNKKYMYKISTYLALI